MDNLINKINELKKQRDAVVLGHYYLERDVLDICDYVGDSFYLAKKATELKNKTIVFCGVRFMGESAKILNPDKTVLLVDNSAICPMANMVTKEDIDKIKAAYDDVCVVAYINSKSEIKRYVDVCVTSGNAHNIIPKIKSKNIYFIPDKNLGGYLARQFPDKNFILHPGYCPVHERMNKDELLEAKKRHPGALVMAHPECNEGVLSVADYIGSTTGIIDYVANSDKDEFIIASELGMFYELEKQNPNKRFYPIKADQICADMKKITPAKIAASLENDFDGVVLSDELIAEAKKSLDCMLEMAK